MKWNDAWYWVLGFTSPYDGQYIYDNAIRGINNTDFNSVTGTKEEIPTIGSTHAIWCDRPGKLHDMESIFNLMDAYSTKYSDYLIRPADYTKVDEAISKVPEDLSVYTDETVAKLQEALNSVVRNKKAIEQDEVDSYAAAINNAIDSLVKKSTSKPSVSDNEPSKTPEQTTTDKKKDSSKSPIKTGDNTNIVALLSLITMSGFVGMLILRKSS